MKKILLLVSIVIMRISISNAQDQPYSYSKIIPPSPEVYSMTKYGDLPVGLVTGTAQFNIPVYTIKAGTLSHNISLNYSSNGVKVDEVSGRIGTDWTLAAGTVVARTIHGLPDGLGVTPLRPATHSVYSQQFWEFLRTFDFFGNNDFDTQPDVFTFSVNGVSGKFIIENGVVKEYKKSGYKIEYNSGTYGTDIVSFKIITKNGDQYNFGNNQAVSKSNSYEENESKNGPHNKAVTAWLLNNIISTTKDTISFNYTTDVVSPEYYSGVSNSYYPRLQDPGVYYAPLGQQYPVPLFNYQGQMSIAERKNYYINAVEEPLLKSISFKDGSLDFKYSDREDLLGDKKLDSVVISGLTGVVKKYFLDYQYSASNSSIYNNGHLYNTEIQVEHPYLTKRLFLKSVTELSRSMDLGSKIGLEYDNINDLPPRLSFSQDLFGYFNGKINQHFFPNDTYTDAQLGHPRFGGDRSFDFNYAGKGVLNKIIYPGKGSTSIEYEPNIVPNQMQVDTIHTISKYKMLNSMKGNVVKSDTIRNASALDIDISVNWFYPGTQPSGKEDEGIFITIINTDNNEIFFNNQLVQVGSSVSFNFLSSADLSNMGKQLPANFIIKFESGANEIAFNAVTTVRKANYVSNLDKPMAGLRVKSIINNNGEGNINKKQYKYSEWDTQNTSGSSGVYLGGDPEYQFVNIERFNHSFQVNDKITTARVCSFVLQSNSVFDLYQSDYRGVLYRTVIEVLGDGVENGGIEHKFNVDRQSYARPLEVSAFPDLINYYTPVYLPGVQSTNTDYLTGNETYSGVFKLVNGARKFITKKYNHYSIDDRNFGVDTFYVVKRAYSDNLFEEPNARNPFGSYDVNKYKINYYWPHLDSTTNVSFSDVDSTVVKTKYQYNNLNNYAVTQVKSGTSKNKTQRIEYNYPYEKVNSGQDPTGIYQAMINQNIIDPVIQQSTFIDDPFTNTSIPIGSSRTNYFNFPGNIIKPITIEENNGLDNSVTKFQFIKYDNFGNLESFSRNAGSKTCYLYSYNGQYPIAEIKNSDFSVIESILGQSAILSFKTLLSPDNETIKSFLAPLYTSLPNIQITLYTYKPLVGMTSMTDSKGQTTYYEYDEFQRLKYVKDQHGNIIKSNTYHYKP